MNLTDYAKAVDRMHPSDALINRTKAAMKTAPAKEPKPLRRLLPAAAMIALAMAAIAFVPGILRVMGPSSKTATQAGTEAPSSQAQHSSKGTVTQNHGSPALTQESTASPATKTQSLSTKAASTSTTEPMAPPSTKTPTANGATKAGGNTMQNAPPRPGSTRAPASNAFRETLELQDGILFFQDAAAFSSPPSPTYGWDKNEYEIQRWSNERAITYLGREFRPAYVPKGLRELNPGGGWALITHKKDGTPHSYQYFSVFYSANPGDPYGPKSRSLQISAAKGGLPGFSAYIYLLQGSNVKERLSQIGETTISVYNKTKTTVDGYEFMATFLFDGIGYCITAYNLTQQEFADILCSVLTP